MRNEVVEIAKFLFDSQEKWGAFLDLYSSKDEITSYWNGLLKSELDKRFMSSEIIEKKWDYRSIPKKTFSFQWYIKELGEASLSLWLEDGRFSLYTFPETSNLNSAYELLRNPEFGVIMQKFRLDTVDTGGYLVIEEYNFNFGTSYDGRYNPDQLAWFAGNRTIEFANQICDKVNVFREDGEMTDLLIRFHESIKK